MKNMKLLVPLALCLLATTSCQQDELVSYNDSNNVVSVSAAMEGTFSRSSVTDLGFFSWQQGDEIGVWATNAVDQTSSFQCLPFKKADANGKGTFEAVLDGAFIFSQYAVYPYSADGHSISESKLTVTLPDTYDYTGKNYTPSTNALMVANIGEETAALGDLDFYHAGGVVSVKLTGLPEGTCGIRLTTDKGVTGEFEVAINSETKLPTISAVAKDEQKPNNIITIKFDALKETPTKIMQFFFPVPVGEYTFTLEYLKPSETVGEYDAIMIEKGENKNIVERSQLILMPERTVVSTGANGENAKKDDYVEVKEGENITYMVYTAKGLLDVNALVQKDLDANITLVKDIDLSEVASRTTATESNWTPIGTSSAGYIGTFNGNGHSITNLIVESDGDAVGLIGRLASSDESKGEVKDVHLINCKISGTGDNVGAIVGIGSGCKISGCSVSGTSSVNGKQYVGGIVGNNGNGSEIANCQVDGSIMVSASNGYVAGIVGQNDGSKISNCTVSSEGKLIIQTVKTDDKTDDNALVGGIAGHSKNSEVSDCHVSGSITLQASDETAFRNYVGGIVGEAQTTTINRCTITVSGNKSITIKGGKYIGGIAGDNSDGSVTDCEVSNTGEGTFTIEGTNFSVGGIGGRNNSNSTHAYIQKCSIRGEITIKSAKQNVGGIIGQNSASNSYYSYVNGCKVEGCTMEGAYRVGGIVGQNGGTITSCYAENVTVKMPIYSADKTEESELVKHNGTVGGIVGLNASNSQAGSTTACYANGCTVSGSSTDADEVIGVNVNGNNIGKVTVCYYDNNSAFKSVSGTTETLTVADCNEWLTARNAMNDEVAKITNEKVTKKFWDGTDNFTDFSTTKP